MGPAMSDRQASAAAAAATLAPAEHAPGDVAVGRHHTAGRSAPKPARRAPDPAINKLHSAQGRACRAHALVGEVDTPRLEGHVGQRATELEHVAARGPALVVDDGPERPQPVQALHDACANQEPAPQAGLGELRLVQPHHPPGEEVRVDGAAVAIVEVVVDRLPPRPVEAEPAAVEFVAQPGRSGMSPGRPLVVAIGEGLRSTSEPAGARAWRHGRRPPAEHGSSRRPPRAPRSRADDGGASWEPKIAPVLAARERSEGLLLRRRLRRRGLRRRAGLGRSSRGVARQADLLRAHVADALAHLVPVGAVVARLAALRAEAALLVALLQAGAVVALVAIAAGVRWGALLLGAAAAGGRSPEQLSPCAL